MATSIPPAPALVLVTSTSVVVEGCPVQCLCLVIIIMKMHFLTNLKIDEFEAKLADILVHGTDLEVAGGLHADVGRGRLRLEVCVVLASHSSALALD